MTLMMCVRVCASATAAWVRHVAAAKRMRKWVRARWRSTSFSLTHLSFAAWVSQVSKGQLLKSPPYTDFFF